MPKLVRLYIVNVAIGFALSAVFVALLVVFDIANLQRLILGSPMGWVAAAMLVMFNGVVFAGAQFAIAVMRLADPPEGPRGGPRRPAFLTDIFTKHVIAPLAVPVRVKAPARHRRR